METLDGRWDVHRLGGLLPPLIGIRKRIDGTSGETALGPLPGLGFDVVGTELRYRRPFRSVVDRLEREGDGWLGRTYVRGHEVGSFRLERHREPIDG